MNNSWKYSAAIIHPTCVGLGLYLGGWWIYSSLFVSSVLYPLLEISLPQAKSQTKPSSSVSISNAIARLTGLSIIAMVVSTVIIAPAGRTVYEGVIITYSCGLSAGIVGVVLAHEFFHRNNSLERYFGIALMVVTSYPHFYLQHLYNHHPNVAKKSDHSSSRRGESVYSFYFRTISAGVRDVWLKECSRSLIKTGARFHPTQNRALAVWLVQIITCLVVFLAFGPWSLLVFVSQGIVAILVLETVNYIQHYGLKRSEAARKNSYEWSWDSYSCTNIALFNLGYHADHHVNPGKKFYELEMQEQAPRMPYGYFTMSALALIPPLWRWVMDERAINLKFKSTC